MRTQITHEPCLNVKIEGKVCSHRDYFTTEFYVYHLSKCATLLIPYHFEKQQIGQFGDIWMIGDAVILEHVTKIPKFGNDVVRDALSGESQSWVPFISPIFSFGHLHRTQVWRCQIQRTLMDAAGEGL